MNAFVQFLSTNWMLIAVLFVSGAMLLFPLVQRQASGMIDVGTLRLTHIMNHEKPLLIDVRSAKDVGETTLPNALHIPLAELKTRAAELTKDSKRPAVVYCARGQQSRGAGSALKAAGFATIYNLSGGFKAWEDAGLPIHRIVAKA